jgi:integrase
VLEVDEVWRIVGAALDDEERAVFLMAYDLALRACEVCRVRGSEVDWRYGRVQPPRAKGGKAVHLAVAPPTASALRPFVRGPGPIFRTWTASRFRDRFRSAVERAGLPAGAARDGGKAFSHILRRSKATHLLERGATLAEVRRHLGHRSLRSTLAYLGMTERQRTDADARAASTLVPDGGNSICRREGRTTMTLTLPGPIPQRLPKP